MSVGLASTVDVVDTEPSLSLKPVEVAAGGVVGAVSKVELVDADELDLVSGKAVLDSIVSVGKVELASDICVGNPLLVDVGASLSSTLVEEELAGSSPTDEVEVASLEVRVGRSGLPGGIRSEVVVEVDSGDEVSKVVVGQPPRQTGMPGIHDALLVVDSVVGPSCVRVVVVVL